MKKRNSESRRKFIKRTGFAGTALLALNMYFNKIWASFINYIPGPEGLGLHERFKTATNFPPFEIYTDFENGNLNNYKIIGSDTIYVGPVSQHRDTWFSFRIKGVKFKKITIVFEWINSKPLPENYNGQVNNTGMVTYDGKGFEIIKNPKYEFKDPTNNSGNYTETLVHIFREDEALVSYCAPWSNTRMAEMSEKLAIDSRVKVSNIGLSKFKNLPLTYYYITDNTVPDTNKTKFYLIAREDSYESGGSWAIEGLIRYILSDDQSAKEMLRKMIFIIFPIFSVDGVAIGSTNFPLDPENTNFVYVTTTWNRNPAYYEVQLMKDFWDKLKNEGFFPEVCFKFHATCYWACHFRPEDCSEENMSKRDELFSILKNNLPWRIKAGPLRNSKSYLGYNFLQVFPDSMTYSSHNDFVFTRQYLGTDKPVYRRNEDVMQDGELIARSFAEYYGIDSTDIAPFLMAGDVNKNFGKYGDSITYSVYYYDLKGLSPIKVEVVINNKAYEMKCPENSDFSKPVLFTRDLKLTDPLNDYYFKAFNGKKSRKIPEDDYLLPGPFIVEKDL